MTEQLLKIKIAIDAQTGQLKVVSDQLGDISDSTKSAAKGIDNVTVSVSSMTKAFVGAKIADKALEIASSLATAKEKAMEFNDKFAEMTTLSNKSTAEYENMRQAILKLDSSASNLQLTEALYQAQSAGIEFSKSLDFVQTSQKLSKAGATDLATATNVLTGTLNAYGFSADNATDFSETLFATVKNGKTRLSELASALGAVAPLASASGVSFKELNAAVATVTSSGVSTSEAMTGIRAILSSIIKPSEDAVKYGKALGLEWNEAGLKAKGLGGLIAELMEKTNGSNSAIMKVVPQVESMSALFSIGANNGEKFNSVMADMANKSDYFNQAATKMQTAKAASEALAKAWDGLLIEIAGSDGVHADFLNSLKDGVIWIRDELPYIQNTIKNLAETVGVLAVGFGTVKTVEFAAGLIASAKAAEEARIAALALASRSGGLFAVEVAATAAAGGIGILNTALNFLARHPVIIGLTAITTAVFAIKNVTENTAIEAKKAIDERTEYAKKKMDELSSKESQTASIIKAINVASAQNQNEVVASLKNSLANLYSEDVKNFNKTEAAKKAGATKNLDEMIEQQKKADADAKKAAEKWVEYKTKLTEELTIKEQDELAKPYTELTQQYEHDLREFKSVAGAKEFITKNYYAQVDALNKTTIEKSIEREDKRQKEQRTNLITAAKQNQDFYESIKDYESAWQSLRIALEQQYYQMTAEQRSARLEQDRLEYLSKNNALNSFSDSLKYNLQRQTADWNNNYALWGKGFADMIVGTQQEMQRNFVDAMSGKINSVGDFFSNIFNSIKRSFFNLVAEIASKQIIMGFTNAWNGNPNTGQGFVERLLGIDIPFLNFAKGTIWGSGNYGIIGNQKVTYDSYANDTIPALISKGEAVIPASAVAANWDLVHALIYGARGNKFAQGYIEKAQIDSTAGVFKLKGGGIFDDIGNIGTSIWKGVSSGVGDLWGGIKGGLSGIASGIMPVMQTLMQNPWIGWAVQAAIAGATIASGGALAPILYPMLTADLIGFGSSLAMSNGNLYKALGSAGISGMTAGATAGIGGLINGLPAETLTFMETVKQYPTAMYNTIVDKVTAIKDFASSMANPSQLADPAMLQNSPTFSDYIKNAYSVESLDEANMLGTVDGTIEKIRQEAAINAYNNLGYGDFSNGTAFANGNSAFMPYDTAFSRGEWGLANYGDALVPASSMSMVDKAANWLIDGLDYAKELGTNGLNSVTGFAQDPTQILQYVTDHIMNIVGNIKPTIDAITSNPVLVGSLAGIGSLKFAGTNGVRAFANGAIVTEPTLGLIGEIPKRPEAIIPLEKSGQIMGIDELISKVDTLITLSMQILSNSQKSTKSLALLELKAMK